MSDSVWPHRQQPTRLRRPWDSPGKNTGVGCHFLLQCIKVKSEREVAQSCPTLSDPMDCSLPSSSIHGIFQARVLEWGAIVRPILFLFFIEPIFPWNIPLVSLIFLKISSFSHSIVFLYFFAWSLRKAFRSLLAILWNSAFKWVYLSFSPLFLLLFFSQLFLRLPQTATLLFCISFS